MRGQVASCYLGAVFLASVALVPAAGAVERGSVTPGRGVDGIRLGMTRAAVQQRLGRPAETTGSEPAGIELRYSWTRGEVALWLTFDPQGGPVRKIQLGVGSLHAYPWCTASRICLGAERGVAKLRAQYAGRLERVQLGYPSYLVKGPGDAYTVFVNPPDPGPSRSVNRGRIMNVLLGYCADTPSC